MILGNRSHNFLSFICKCGLIPSRIPYKYFALGSTKTSRSGCHGDEEGIFSGGGLHEKLKQMQEVLSKKT